MFTGAQPVIRSKNSWKIGMRRVDKIVKQETNDGFFARPTGIYSDMVDILVFRDSQLVRVYEVTNWGKPEFYLQPVRAEGYLKNLMQYPDSVEKIFICSFEENLSTVGGKSFFEEHGIEVRVMGYQD